jgi:hypothetical protein
MNTTDIIDTLIARIEDRLTETANPCKAYKTRAAALKATANMAQDAANHFAIDYRNGQHSARYAVFYVEKMQKWVGAIDLTELLQRKTSTGGYLGICSQKGFYSF